MAHDAASFAAACPLTDEEDRTAARLATPELQLRWRGARAVLRLVLSTYVGCAPADVPMGIAPCVVCGGPHGKPVVVGSRLHTNLSHAGDAVAVVVAASPVGVDIELPGHLGDPSNLSNRFYASVEANWVQDGSEDERERRFLLLWVRKEALLKATGEGLPGGLGTTVVLGPTPITVSRRVAGAPSQWTVTDMGAATHPCGAVALAGDLCELRVLQLADLARAADPARQGPASWAGDQPPPSNP